MTTGEIFITPKIKQPGDAPEGAGAAAAVGSARIIPKDTSRKITVYTRSAYSTDAWTIIKGPVLPESDGYVYFNAWSGNEYQAKVAAGGGEGEYYFGRNGVPARYEWNLIFSDDFDGSTLNPVWQTRGNQYVPGAMDYARADDSATFVNNGAVHLTTIADPVQPAGYYLNGHIGTQSRFEFTYGWAAARVRFHKWRGSHSCFWLQSTTGYIPGQSEIDCGEYFGSNDPTKPEGTNLWFNVYADSNGDGTMEENTWSANDVATLPSGDKWHNSFHVYAVRWTPDSYQFYIDGQKVHTKTNLLSDQPKFLVLSMLTRNYEVGNMYPDKLSTYKMDVDWVRVWQ